MAEGTVVAILEYLGIFGFGALVGAGVLAFVLKSFIPAYLSQKGKNLATREDIAEITTKVEAIRTEYAKQLQEFAHQNTLLIEAFRGKSQLRLAAAEKRLEAHQRAFALWRKLLANVHGEEQWKVVNECQKWWEENCIYLSPIARQAFSDAYWAVNMHPALLRDRSNPKAVTDNWDTLMKAGNRILEGAELPALGEREVLTPGQPAPAPNPGVQPTPESGRG
jgi:hypothetical protein